MTIHDQRTPAQRSTHQWAIVARDTMPHHEGGATGGTSRCAWAVPEVAMLLDVEAWVSNRTEMRSVRIINLNTFRPPKGTARFAIYPIGLSHNAFKHYPKRKA